MKWINNLESLSKSGVVGRCPFCDGSNTCYNVTKVSGNMGYAVLWCNDCGEFHVVSRLEITELMKNGREVPASLFI